VETANSNETNDGSVMVRCLLAVGSFVKSKSTFNSDFSSDDYLLSDVELLLECGIESEAKLDIMDSDRAAFVSSQLEEWKTTFLSNERKTADDEEKVLKLSKIADVAAICITDDERSIINHLEKKITLYLKDMERAVRSLETFVGQVGQMDQLNDPLDVAKATVECLKDGKELSPWSLDCHRSRYQIRLVEIEVCIWKFCNPNKKELDPKSSDAPVSPLAFLEILLSSNSSALLSTRLAIADQLLLHHLDTPQDVITLKHWSDLVARFSSDGSDQLSALQSSLIGHFGVYKMRQVYRHSKANRQSIQFNSKEIVDQLMTLTRLLAKSQVEINQLLISALLRLIKALEECARDNRRLLASEFLADYLKDLLGDKKSSIYKQNVKITTILFALFSVLEDKPGDNYQNLLSPHEKGFLERCINSESCLQNTENQKTLYEAVQKVKRSQQLYSKTSDNRLISSSVRLEDLFTREEKRCV